jgi:phage shock protein A
MSHTELDSIVDKIKSDLDELKKRLVKEMTNKKKRENRLEQLKAEVERLDSLEEAVQTGKKDIVGETRSRIKEHKELITEIQEEIEISERKISEIEDDIEIVENELDLYQ